MCKRCVASFAIAEFLPGQGGALWSPGYQACHKRTMDTEREADAA